MRYLLKASGCWEACPAEQANSQPPCPASRTDQCQKPLSPLLSGSAGLASGGVAIILRTGTDWNERLTLVTHPDGLGCMLQREVLCHQEVSAVTECTMFQFQSVTTGSTILSNICRSMVCFAQVCTVFESQDWSSMMVLLLSSQITLRTLPEQSTEPSKRHLCPAHVCRCGWTTS